jgi:S-DNA-T family DNA segregation ATPase FtsK/SpoIIIE
MFYVTSELPKPKRVQGAYVHEKEIKRVTDFLREETGMPIYNHEIVERPKPMSNVPGFDGDDGGDDLMAQAIEVVQNAGKASASLLQRRLSIGYARAARILDILEDKGIIGPGEGAKPREVYGAGNKTEEGFGDEAADFEKAQKDDY